jgi:hypothetical protein
MNNGNQYEHSMMVLVQKNEIEMNIGLHQMLGFLWFTHEEVLKGNSMAIQNSCSWFASENQKGTQKGSVVVKKMAKYCAQAKA